MTKQWQTQSDQHDGIIQIKGYFYSSSTFSELKTKNKKKKEKRNPTMLVSYIYKKKKKEKKEAKLFTSMTAFSNHWFSKGKGEKCYYLTVNPFL